MRRFPGTHAVYKKNAAAQFTIINPRIDENGRIEKNGAVLLEASASIGDKSYDWKNKISFAIGMNDISIWFNNQYKPNKLIHKTPNSSLMKSLEVVPGEGRYEGTFQLKLSEKNSKTDTFRSVFIPMSAGEYTVLLRLLMHAAPLLIGWDNESPVRRN
jgi:hypothetical protein